MAASGGAAVAAKREQNETCRRSNLCYRSCNTTSEISSHVDVDVAVRCGSCQQCICVTNCRSHIAFFARLPKTPTLTSSQFEALSAVLSCNPNEFPGVNLWRYHDKDPNSYHHLSTPINTRKPNDSTIAQKSPSPIMETTPGNGS
jgi:hypothetical protein